MNKFQINANEFLGKCTVAFFHLTYTRMGHPGNPDYLNDLKNTYNSFAKAKLVSAARELEKALQADFPQILQLQGLKEMVVCVVPRAKAESNYHPNQQLFRSTVQAITQKIPGLVDGTGYLCRHINTKTTHLRNPIPNYTNDGPDPYPGITTDTCAISPDVVRKDILLVDDIYTPGVNIDEDAINALRGAGAKTVTFYAVGRVQRN